MKVVVVAVAVAACTPDDGGPRLERATPARAARGAMVTIEGRNFCNGDCASAAGEIVLGLSPPQVRVTVLALDAREATIQIPSIAPVGPTEIVMTIDEQASNALPFEVLEPMTAEQAWPSNQ